MRAISRVLVAVAALLAFAGSALAQGTIAATSSVSNIDIFQTADAAAAPPTEASTVSPPSVQASSQQATAPQPTGWLQFTDITVKPGYELQDVGAWASHEPVLQIDHLWSKGPWTFGPWISLGPTQFGKELDLLAFYNNCARAFGVQFCNQLSVQYYFLNGTGGAFDWRNQVAEVYAETSVPLHKGKWTVAPVVRVVQMVGLKNYPVQTLLQPGVRVTFVPTDQWTLKAEFRESYNVSYDRKNLRFNLSATHKWNQHLDFPVLGFEGTDQTGHLVTIGATIH